MATMIEMFGGSVMSPVPDPYPVYRKLRHESPVILLQTIMGEQYMVTRYDDVFACLKNNAVFSSRSNARGIGVVMGRTILEMDGKEHLRHRALVSPAFLPHSLQKHAPAISAIADELIDGFAREGRADLVQQFTFVFPMRVITYIIGVPVEDYHKFHHWALDVIGVADNPERGLESAKKIVDYLRPILERRRREPTDDLLSKLVHAEIEGHRLTEEEVLSFLRLLLPAGADTTYRLLGSALYALLTHRQYLEEVLADPEKIDWAIEETLRWEAPVQYVSREPVEDVEVAGVKIPKGAGVQLAIGSANRDEEHFPDPDRFDLHRRPTDHLPFGFGQHFCAGSHLAKLEARTALPKLLHRLRNLRLDPSQECRIVGLAFRSPDRLPVLFDPER
ncbi:MAG: cytochrome P450 [Candidatus Binatia bacterium]|nr:MAG: cytochrome P450 [Candidatus Binatia bacterium]